MNLLWDGARKSLDVIEEAQGEGLLAGKGWRKGKYWRREAQEVDEDQHEGIIWGWKK